MLVLKQYPEIMKNLEIETGPSPLEMLKYMHDQNISQSHENSDGTEDSDDPCFVVLPNWLFQKIWRINAENVKKAEKQNNTNVNPHI